MNAPLMIVRRFRAAFGPPDTDDYAQLLAEYRRALGGWDPAIIEAAVDHLIDRHPFRSWPTIGAITAAAEAVAKRLLLERRARMRSLPAPQQAARSPEERARVAALVAAFRRGHLLN